MKIAYGPPAVAGVKHLQYIGDDADYVSTAISQYAKPAAAIAAGVWGYAFVTKNPQLKKQALAVGLGAFIVQMLSK